MEDREAYPMTGRDRGDEQKAGLSPWDGRPVPAATMKELLAAQDQKLSAGYIDKTGTDQKPNPMTDVFLEFPLAMAEIAKVTAFGARKHAPRGWQTFKPDYAFRYHMSKLGRHLLALETEGPVNHSDGDVLHAAQAAWNILAYLEHFLRSIKTPR